MSLRRSRPLEDALRQVRDRALGSWSGASRLRRGEREPAAHLPVREQRRVAALLAACLEPRLGEVIARARAAELAALYLGLDNEGRARFFQVLASRASIDPAAIENAVAEYRRALAERGSRRPPHADRTGSADDDTALQARADAPVMQAAAALREAATPSWERLFRLFCGLDHGVKFAVDLRADLLSVLADARRGKLPEELDPERLARVDDDLRSVLKALFDVGLLQLRRITWQSPAAFLEKLIRYEAVHAITSWADLKNRLRDDRRCYAFLHPGMPDEPLIFVEVALTSGMAERIGPLLDLDSPLTDNHEADTAIFYSISACQDGLAGVSLGDFLIKQVVTDLARELPGLKCFATLSPIPGFRAWLTDQLQRSPSQLLGFLDNEQRAALADVARHSAAQNAHPDDGEPAVGQQTAVPAARHHATGHHATGRNATGRNATGRNATGRSTIGRNDADTAGRGLTKLLESTAWVEDRATAEAVKPALVRLAARYLTAAGEDQRVLDRVGNFHLTNGARVERVNWLANTSLDGLRQSLGLMVNYRYDLDRIERNHTDYVLRGHVSTSPAVGRLLG